MNPEAAWLKSNREILLSQIVNSGAKELSNWQRLVIDLRSFISTISQPALALGSLFMVVVGASVFGHLAFGRTKPNDSLYIARIISEKAKLSTVFNNEEREKLEVKFAADHAEAITEVLASATAEEANADQLAYLNESFNKEIETVRAKMAVIGSKAEPVVEPAAAVAVASGTEEELLVTAGNAKDATGMQLQLNNGSVDTKTATLTTEVVTEPIVTETQKAPAAILEEAQALFDNKEYDSALDKLKEVKELIK